MSINSLPISERLKVAYLATAYAALPGHSAFKNASPEDFQSFTSDNEYRRIWNRINRFFESSGLSEMSKVEINEFYQTAFHAGVEVRGHRLTPEAVQEATQLWRKRGWFRYEHIRDERFGQVYTGLKVCTFVGLAICGIPISDS